MSSIIPIPVHVMENLKALRETAGTRQEALQKLSEQFRQEQATFQTVVNRYNTYVEAVADMSDASLEAYRLDFDKGRFEEMTDAEKAMVAEQKAQQEAAAQEATSQEVE